MKLSIRRIQVIVIITILFSNISNAQITKNNELYQTLKVKDSLFFEGFNTCNLAMIEELLPEKFEFFHDKDGLTSSKDVFISNLKKNLCSSGKNITKRVLIKGSLKVFPLYNSKKLYAAIQTGRHSFGSTIARFTNLFILDNGNWMPTRIMSYDQYAEEIVQDSFMKAFNGLKSFNKTAKFKSWFYRIIVNESFQRLKKLKKITQVEYVPEIHDDLSSESNFEVKNYKLEQVEKTMESLQPKESLAINLFYLEAYSLKEITDITGWKMANTKVLLHRARKKIRLQLDNKNKD